MKPIINSSEAAQLLQASKPHVCTLAANGEIPAFRVGDDWRFVTEQLISYLADKAAQQQRQREAAAKSEPLKPASNKRGRPRGALVDLSKYG